MRGFAYSQPETPSDVVRALAAGGAGTRLIAGGTTLYDLMKLNIERPTSVVDVTGLRELALFDTSGERELIFGALARMSDVAADRTALAGLSRTRGVAPESRVATAAEHGDARRQSAATHALRLFPRRRAVRMQQANARDPAARRSAGSIAVMPCSAEATHASPSIRATGRWRSSPSTPRSTSSDRDGQRTIAVEALHREPGDHSRERYSACAERADPPHPCAGDATRPFVDLPQNQGP